MKNVDAITTRPKPLPLDDLDQVPYWEAARQHQLALQKCLACGELVHPPGPGCPWCGGADLDWVNLGSDVTGTVYSFIVVHRAFLQSFVNDVPYVVALCEIEGAPGVRITANIRNIDPTDVHIGMRVRMVWEERTPDSTIPQWEPLARP